jgi:hypothetical protein
LLEEKLIDHCSIERVCFKLLFIEDCILFIAAVVLGQLLLVFDEEWRLSVIG